jgi:hypothetical protein
MLWFSVTSRALRMPGVATRAVASHDRGEETSGRSVRSLLRGRGLEGPQKPLRTPQSVGRKGKTTY